MKIKIYKFINIITLILAIFIFIILYGMESTIFEGFTMSILIILFLTAVIVHSMKAVRLYFELYERRMSFEIFIRQYCKVIPVSMILPFKIGDSFRAYCYGYYLKSYMTGIAAIILDRFVDTVALVTTLAIFSFAFGFRLPKMFYALLFF